MKYGFRCAQLKACCFVSKNRSITIAFRSRAFRPRRRAAFRLRTAEPVSAAIKVPSGSVTLLPYGMRRGSTAQCPARKRAPLAPICCRVQRSDPPPPLAQYTVTRARTGSWRAKAEGAKKRMAVTAIIIILFMVWIPGFQSGTEGRCGESRRTVRDGFANDGASGPRCRIDLVRAEILVRPVPWRCASRCGRAREIFPPR